MKTAKERLTRARMQLLLSNPMMAYLAFRMPLREARGETETMATDGEYVYYNPAYVEKLSDSELLAVYCEELLHIGLLHPFRGQGKDHENWNKACDQVIMNTLTAAGYKIPSDSFYRKEWDGLSAEAVYAKLQQEKQQQRQNQSQSQSQSQGQDQGQSQSQDQGQRQSQPQQQSGPLSGGEVIPSQLKGAQRDAAQNEIKMAMAQALAMAKAAGKVPGAFTAMVEQILAPSLNWREVLSRFLDRFVGLDYTYAKSSNYYLQQGIIIPSLAKPTRVRIALIRDTSGSMTDQMKQVCSDTLSVLLSYPQIQAALVDTDVEVQRVVENVDPDDPTILEWKGGGGTDFRAAMKWLRNQDLNGAIFITDGETISWGEDPEIDVLWILVGARKDVTPPFGEVVRVNGGGEP
jgi:predicted metal-dependent peptidase